MKLFNQLLTMTALAFAPHIAEATDYIVAIASPMDKTHEKPLQAFLGEVPLGSETILLDAQSQRVLCTFTVPDNKIYRHIKARFKHNRRCFAALKKAQSAKKQAGMPIPQILSHVAENYETQGLDVVLLGQPFYHKPAEPALSMLDGNIPSDGHINAHRSASVYGTKGLEYALTGARLHFAFPPQTPLINNQHKHFLRRFWSLYGQAQGASLVSFHNDAMNVFTRVLNNAKPPVNDYVLDKVTKLEMLRIRLQPPATPIYQRSLSHTPLSAAHIANAHNVEIAISWDCKSCDLDLYVRPWDNAPVLFFGQPSTAQGSFWKDFTNSPRAANAWETISLHVPIDLNKTLIAANFYGGNAPKGIQGELRITASGQTYAKPFTISATTGKEQNGIRSTFETGKAQGTHILTFRPADIIKAQ